jgi:hypothetical protein
MRDRIVVLISLLLLAGVTWGQQQSSGSSAPSTSQQSMPGMDMSGHDMSNMQMKDMPMATDKDKDADKDGDASAHAMHSMEGHMDMGPHMKMTALRPAKPGDAARAEQVVESARKASEKYLTIAPLWPRATRFSILRFRRRCITSLTTDTRWKRLFVSLPSIPPRCSMKNMAKTTN